jgi:geranylgeranyl diphosphate synthase type I
VRAQPTTGAAAYAASLTGGFETALLAFVAGLDSHRELVGYAVRSGHRTRPVGCLLACEAVGGDWCDALGAAVGIELLHKSSIIRDDIVDGDATRSGQPAFHAAHGVPSAVAVSDLLWTMGMAQIARGAPSARAHECLQAATDVLQEMAAGQLEDVVPSAHRRRAHDRLEIEEQKTGSLAGLACGLGAVLGGGTPQEIAALTDYGRKIGTAFQVLNDVRNLAGEEVARSAASDLRKRRDTVLSAYACEAGAHPGPRGTGDLNDAELEQARRELLSTGALEFGDRLAARLLDEARGYLEALPATPACVILASLTRGVLRDHAF